SGGSWNASIVAEVASWGDTKLKAMGLGSYIADATESADYPRVVLGIVVMSVMVVTCNRLIWRPLHRLARRPIRLSWKRGAIDVASAAKTAPPTGVAPLVVVDHVRQLYAKGGGDRVLVLDDVSLALRSKEIVSLLGRSGCGKSSLLRIIAGLMPSSEGKVT